MKYLVVLVLIIFFTGCTTFKTGYTEVKDYDFTKPLDTLKEVNPEISTYSVLNNDYPYIEMESIYGKWGEPDASRTGWAEIGKRLGVMIAFGATELLSWPLVVGVQVLVGPPCSIETWTKENKKIEIESCSKWLFMRRRSLVRKWQWTENKESY